LAAQRALGYCGDRFRIKAKAAFGAKSSAWLFATTNVVFAVRESALTRCRISVSSFAL
jgi:hypothetical protein